MKAFDIMKGIKSQYVSCEWFLHLYYVRCVFLFVIKKIHFFVVSLLIISLFFFVMLFIFVLVYDANSVRAYVRMYVRTSRIRTSSSSWQNRCKSGSRLRRATKSR